MECPKCKKELMNINGRLICVECGTEVQESELNTPSLPTDMLNIPDVTPEIPVSPLETPAPAVVPEEVTTPEVNAENTVEQAPVPEAPAVEAVQVESETPSLAEEPAMPAPEEVPAVQTAEMPSEVAEAADTANVVQEPVNLVEPEMDASLPETPVELPESPEITTVEEAPALEIPAVEPTVAEETLPQADEAVSEPIETPAPVEDQAPAENLVAETMTNEPEVLQESVPEPSAPIADMAPSIDTITAPAASTTVPSSPVPTETSVPTSEVDFSKDAPIDPFEVTAPTTGATSNVDPNLYQNPIFDSGEPQLDQGQTVPPVQADGQVQAQPVVGQAATNKKLILMLAGGLVLFSMLLGGGIFAYTALTKPTVVEPSNINEDNITSNIDTNNPTLVFANNLSTCTKFKNTYPNPITGGNFDEEILGLVDGKCDFIQKMPNNGQLECKLDEATRKSMTAYLQKTASATNFESSTNSDTIKVDGEEIENTLQKAIESKTCVITGYN